MVNDPLIGWITDKKFGFTKRWGRRYPFFAIGAVSFVWIYLFIFTVPFSDQIGMFVWLLVTICIFEFLYSLFIKPSVAAIHPALTPKAPFSSRLSAAAAPTTPNSVMTANTSATLIIPKFVHILITDNRFLLPNIRNSWINQNMIPPNGFLYYIRRL